MCFFIIVNDKINEKTLINYYPIVFLCYIYYSFIIKIVFLYEHRLMILTHLTH